MKHIEINVGTQVDYLWVMTLQEFWLCEDSNQTFHDPEMLQRNLDKVRQKTLSIYQTTRECTIIFTP